MLIRIRATISEKPEKIVIREKPRLWTTIRQILKIPRDQKKSPRAPRYRAEASRTAVESRLTNKSEAVRPKKNISAPARIP